MTGSCSVHLWCKPGILSDVATRMSVPSRNIQGKQNQGTKGQKDQRPCGRIGKSGWCNILAGSTRKQVSSAGQERD